MNVTKDSFIMKVRSLDSIVSQEVKGYSFKIQDITFIIHRPLNKKKQWTVSEKTTGMKISPVFDVREQCYNHVVHLVSNIGYDKVVERINQVKEREKKQ